MESNSLIKIIEENSIAITEVNTLEQAAIQFPYATLLQQLSFNAQAIRPDEGLVQKASLYKTHPYLFVYHKNNFRLLDNESKKPTNSDQLSDDLVMPLFTEDYFTHQGIKSEPEQVEAFVKQEEEKAQKLKEEIPEEQQLLITRSFEDWLAYFKQKREKEQKEEEAQKAFKSMWQKEKLSKALAEDNDDDEAVPEQVFNMAINSINLNEGTASEALANIFVKQGKFSKAIEMYRKLSLQNPEKSAYFAAKLKEIEKLT
jgi:tetratricopeptide (TPR) repeat protein